VRRVWPLLEGQDFRRHGLPGRLARAAESARLSLSTPIREAHRRQMNRTVSSTGGESPHFYPTAHRSATDDAASTARPRLFVSFGVFFSPVVIDGQTMLFGTRTSCRTGSCDGSIEPCLHQRHFILFHSGTPVSPDR